MVGRRFVTLLGLVAIVAPGQVAFALPDLPPPPPPPQAPPPPPTGLRPLVGPDGRMVTDAQGRPQFVIDLPQPPVAPARPTNVPQVLMRHLSPASPMPGVAGPGAPPPVALPVPAAGQGLREVTQQRIIVPPPPGVESTLQQEPSSTLPQVQPVKPVQTPPPPPSEGGRRPGGPRGI